MTGKEYCVVVMSYSWRLFVYIFLVLLMDDSIFIKPKPWKIIEIKNSSDSFISFIGLRESNHQLSKNKKIIRKQNYIKT